MSAAIPAPTDPLSRVAVALDTPDRETFSGWCRLFGPRVGVLKVGLEAFVRWGPGAVEEAKASNPRVFLDLKLHDIPHTVAGAVRSARALGVRYLTVHASGGRPMLEAAAEAAGGQVDLLAVTLLTHLDDDALRELDLSADGRGSGSATRARRWAALARSSGCAGAVCSPLEAAALRAENPVPFVLVTPGVRPAGSASADAADDQRRVATPARALEAGSDLLVIGRPLTRSADPEVALSALSDELARGH